MHPSTPEPIELNWMALLTEGHTLAYSIHNGHPTPNLVSFLQKLELLPPAYSPPDPSLLPVFSSTLKDHLYPHFTSLWPAFLIPLDKALATHPLIYRSITKCHATQPLSIFFSLLWTSVLSSIVAQLAALQLLLNSPALSMLSSTIEAHTHIPPANSLLSFSRPLPRHWLPTGYLPPTSTPVPTPTDSTPLWTLSWHLNPLNPTTQQHLFYSIAPNISPHTAYFNPHLSGVNQSQPLFIASLHSHSRYQWHTARASVADIKNTTSQICNNALCLEPLSPSETNDLHTLPLSPLFSLPSPPKTDIGALLTTTSPSQNIPDWHTTLQILQHLTLSLCDPSESPTLQVSNTPRGTCTLHSPNPLLSSNRQVCPVGSLNWRKTIAHLGRKALLPLHHQLHALQIATPLIQLYVQPPPCTQTDNTTPSSPVLTTTPLLARYVSKSNVPLPIPHTTSSQTLSWSVPLSTELLLSYHASPTAPTAFLLSSPYTTPSCIPFSYENPRLSAQNDVIINQLHQTISEHLNLAVSC